MSIAKILVPMFRAQMATWNPSDKAALISLSNSDLTAQKSSGGTGHTCVRATRPKSTGKKYFEVAMTGSTSGTRQVNVGLVEASFGLSGSSALPGNTTTGGGVGYWPWLGDIRIASSSSAPASPGVVTGAATLRFAVDFDNDRFWASKVGNDWNGDPAANPATNTGGVDISSVLSTEAYICVDVFSDTGESAVLNAGSSAFSGSIPSGFQAWSAR